MKTIGVALFVYKRAECTLRTINSIKQSISNTGIDKLYVFQDGPKKQEDLMEWEKVNQLVKNIDFIEVEFIVSDKNKGLANSIIQGIDYMLTKHDRVITIEDDCEVGKSYFEFMKYCFDKYEKNPKVMCVSGYCWPINIPNDYKYNVYFSYRMSSVGWGTWKDRWSKYKRDFSILRNITKDEEKKKILDLAGNDVIPILEGQLQGKTDSWAIFWQLVQNDNLGVCVQPTKSLAKDIGRDGTGTNTVVATNEFDVDLFDYDILKLEIPNDIQMDSKIINEISELLNFIPNDVKLKKYHDLLNRWVKNLYNKYSLEKYFQNNNIEEVYIYGSGNLAGLLIDEIKKYVKISGIIVENKENNEFEGYKIYNIDEKIIYNNELIIVTPIYDYKNIKHKISEICNINKIMSLEDLINKEMI